MAGPQCAAFPFGQAAPDAVGDPVADGVVQARLPDRASPRRSAARARPTRRGPGRTLQARRRGTQPASRQRGQRPGWRSGGAVPRRAGRHRDGRGDPRPPGGGEGGQVGHLQAAGREVVGEPPREPAGGLPVAPAHHGVRQRARRSPAAGPSPGRLPAAPRAALRSGSPRASVPGRFRLAGRRDERCRQGPGHCFQQLGRDRGDRGSLSCWAICRASLHGGFLSQGPCPLGDLGGWSRGPLCARIAPGWC